MPTKLFRVILPVADIERAATFYRDVLGFEGRRVSPGRHYFDCGGTILACFDPRADGDDWDATPNPDHVSPQRAPSRAAAGSTGCGPPDGGPWGYFSVDDLEATFERAKRAGCARVDDAIETRPWGERSFYAKDPFGNRICFVDATTVFTGK